MSAPSLLTAPFQAKLRVQHDAEGLEEPSFQEMLHFVLHHKLNVKMQISSLGMTLHFQEGRIEAVSGFRPLGEVLVQQGLVSADTVQQALRGTQSLGQSLLRNRIISSLQLRSALRQQVRDSIDYLFDNPPEHYELEAAQPLPLPTANIDGQEILSREIKQPLSMSLAYQIAPQEGEVTLSPRSWQVLRYINGKRKLRRVLKRSELPEEEFQEIVRDLLQRDLIEPVVQLGLRFIVPKRKPLSSTTHPPAAIRANLFLKHVNGEQSAWAIQKKLGFPSDEVKAILTSLYRDNLIEIVGGQDEFLALLDEH